MPNFWTILKWSGIVLGPMITVAARIIEFYQAISLPWPVWTFEVGGFLVFCASVAGLLVGYQRENKALHSKVDELINKDESKLSEVQNLGGSLVHTPVTQPFLGRATKAIDRELVAISPEDLTGFYKGRTNAEGDRLAAPYMHRWIKIGGYIGNVDVNSLFGSVRLAERSNGVYSTELQFHPTWNHRLSTFRVGDRLEVIGTIESVGPATLRLERCEIVNS